MSNSKGEPRIKTVFVWLPRKYKNLYNKHTKFYWLCRISIYQIYDGQKWIDKFVYKKSQNADVYNVQLTKKLRKDV